MMAGWMAVRSGNTDNFAEGTRANWLLRNLGDGRFEDATESSGILQRRDGDTSKVVGAVWALPM